MKLSNKLKKAERAILKEFAKNKKLRSITIPILPTSEESDKLVDEMINRSRSKHDISEQKNLISRSENEIYQKGVADGAAKERKYIMEYITSWPNFPDKKADINLYYAIKDLLSRNKDEI